MFKVAATEGDFANSLQTIREGDARQGRTVLEGSFFNDFNTLRNDHTGEGGAIRKSKLADGCDIAFDGDAL